MVVRNIFYIVIGLTIGVSLALVVNFANAFTTDTLTSDLVESINSKSVIDLITTQDLYYTLTGEFKQIPEVLNVYESSDGWGYQTVEYLKDEIIYTGYGANAKDYTYTIVLNDPYFATDKVASSTGGNIDIGLQPDQSLGL